MLVLTIPMLNVYANPAQDKLMSMSEIERQNVLTNYLKQSGEKCAVKSIYYQGATPTNDVFWNVRCKAGNAFSIMIKNDAQGTTFVIDCAVLKKINTGECFKKFKS